MFRLVLSAAVALTLGCLFPALAAAQPAPAAPAAAATDDLRYFVGQWRVAAEDPQTRETLLVSYTVEPVLDGRWLAGSGVSDPPGFQARDMWGRDPSTGELIRVVFDGGGAVATIRSRGWTGDTLIFEGEARHGGGSTRVRETITRVGPAEFRAVWESFRDGAWTAYSVERVTRRTAA